MFFRYSSLHQCVTFGDLEIGYSILHSASSLKLSTLTKFEADTIRLIKHQKYISGKRQENVYRKPLMELLCPRFISEFVFGGL